MPTVLVIAGTDSSGGAGLLADAEAIRDFGCALRCCVTAVTAQSDKAVGGALLMPADLVGRQIEMAMADGQVGAVKIGMLGHAATVSVVTERLAGSGLPIVLDPVLSSSSGTALLDDDGIALLIARLLPMATLVTPNLPELARLALLFRVAAGASVEAKAEALLAAGARAVLVKGGHATGETARDLLFAGTSEPATFDAPRLAVSMRGTGCRLASAIAARLSEGATIEAACRAAKTYLAARFADAASRDKPGVSY